MLTKDQFNEILSRLPEFQAAPEKQLIEGSGFDGVIDLLSQVRTSVFPVAVLETRPSGSISLTQGAVDSSSQSIWVFGQQGREEDEPQLYAEIFRLVKKILAQILASSSELDGEIQWQRVTYQKRYGGPNARGYEISLLWQEDISLDISDYD